MATLPERLGKLATYLRDVAGMDDDADLLIEAQTALSMQGIGEPTQEQIDAVAGVIQKIADDPLAQVSAIITTKMLLRALWPWVAPAANSEALKAGRAM